MFMSMKMVMVMAMLVFKLPHQIQILSLKQMGFIILKTMFRILEFKMLQLEVMDILIILEMESFLPFLLKTLLEPFLKFLHRIILD